MARVGVRELKNQTTQILREVRENREADPSGWKKKMEASPIRSLRNLK